MKIKTQKSITKKISKKAIKQAIHAYIPILLLIILPKSFISLGVAGIYFVIVSFMYLSKARKGEKTENFEYFFANGIISLIALGGYVNVL